jgi:ribonuclease R
MQDHVGEEFDGTISGVTSFGLSSRSTSSTSTAWCTSPTWARTFQFDAAKHMLRGERSARPTSSPGACV